MQIIERAWELKQANTCTEWDVCLDGIWYSLNMELDTSDRAWLLNTILEHQFDIQNIPFWNSCDIVNKSGYKKMVRVEATIVYLIEFGEC